MILMGTVASNRELQALLEEKISVTQDCLPTENSIIGSASQSQVVTVNPAFGRPIDLAFVKLLF